MHVHLPKPLHGRRAFIGEVGIIVLGVLIALGAEQVAEAWQWHQKVGVVRKSLIGELANDRARWELDLGEVRCTLRDVETLDGWAEAGTLPPTAASARGLKPTSLLRMHSANWTLATGSQTFDHFPIDDQLAFAALYDGIAHRQVDIESARELLQRVQSEIPLANDAQGRRDLRTTLGDLKQRIGVLVENQAYMKRHFDAVGVRPDRSDFAADFTDSGCTY